MSQLPKGTLAARSFLEDMILKGALAQAYAFAPWLQLPVLRHFFEALVTRMIIRPLGDESTALALAAVYAIDRSRFDKTFITLKMLDKQNASPEEIEKALTNAQNAMQKFIRRGPLS